MAVTGPSGSGKSTLVFDILARGDARGPENAVSGCAHLDRIVAVGQAPIARMKRSNVATYTDVWAPVRAAFAASPEARSRGLAAKAFSFNTPGGRCETCEGMGTVTSNLLFFQDVQAPCPACHGRRFHDEVLEATLDGRSIADVLALSVDEARDVFSARPKIARALGLLSDVGLGYLELGRPACTRRTWSTSSRCSTAWLTPATRSWRWSTTIGCCARATGWSTSAPREASAAAASCSREPPPSSPRTARAPRPPACAGRSEGSRAPACGRTRRYHRRTEKRARGKPCAIGNWAAPALR